MVGAMVGKPKYCWKVARVESNNDFKSIFTQGPVELLYKVGIVTKAIKGTGILCFEEKDYIKQWIDLESLIGWCPSVLAILKCEYGEKVKLGMRLGAFCSLFNLELVENAWKDVIVPNSWPEGTVAYDWIKPIEIVELYRNENWIKCEEKG